MIAVAVYADADSVGVYPCTDGTTTWSVTACIDALTTEPAGHPHRPSRQDAVGRRCVQMEPSATGLPIPSLILGRQIDPSVLVLYSGDLSTENASTQTHCITCRYH